MTVKKNEDGTPTDPALAAIADEIAARGAAGDPVSLVLAKGLTDGLGKLTDLALLLGNLAKGGKGKKPPAAKDDDDDDDGDGDEGGEGNAPGYQDMNMGRSAPIVPPVPATPAQTGDAVLDVTQFVFDTGERMARLEKAVADGAKREALLIDLVKGQQAQLETLGQMVQVSTEATMATLAPLAKAVSDQRETLLNIPAPGITPKRMPPPKPAAPDAAFIGGTKRTELQALSKAMSTGVIDGLVKQTFLNTRRFHPDDARNAEIRSRVESCAAAH
jgi:hypothetical protein